MARWTHHRRRRKGELLPLGELMLGAYPSKEPRELLTIRAYSWWEKAVPRRVAKNARPVRLDKGVLTIHAATSVWASELDFLKQQLLESLLRAVPKCGVRELRVRVGKLPAVPAPPRPVRKAPPVVPVARLPEDLARSLAAVGDDDVRGAVHRAASVSLARSGNREGHDKEG